MSVFSDCSFEVIVITKRINKIIIVFMVITITLSFCFSVSAAEKPASEYFSLIRLKLESRQGSYYIDCDISYEYSGTDVIVTLSPKDKLDFLILLDNSYMLYVDLVLTSDFYFNYILFDDSLPVKFVASSQPMVEDFIYKLNERTVTFYSFNCLDDVTDFTFALSDDTLVSFPGISESPLFLVFLSDIVILFDNSLAWFNELFSYISLSAPLLILFCGFVIVGYSFSLLRRFQR